MNLPDLPLEELRGMLRGAVPGARAGQPIPEALAALEAVPLEVVLLYSEFVRRNLVPLHCHELGTYEDAAKWLVIPELTRRLQEAARERRDLDAKLKAVLAMLEANGIATPPIEGSDTGDETTRLKGRISRLENAGASLQLFVSTAVSLTPEQCDKLRGLIAAWEEAVRS